MIDQSNERNNRRGGECGGECGGAVLDGCVSLIAAIVCLVAFLAAVKFIWYVVL